MTNPIIRYIKFVIIIRFEWYRYDFVNEIDNKLKFWNKLILLKFMFKIKTCNNSVYLTAKHV